MWAKNENMFILSSIDHFGAQKGKGCLKKIINKKKDKISQLNVDYI